MACSRTAAQLYSVGRDEGNGTAGDGGGDAVVVAAAAAVRIPAEDDGSGDMEGDACSSSPSKRSA